MIFLSAEPLNSFIEVDLRKFAVFHDNLRFEPGLSPAVRPLKRPLVDTSTTRHVE